MSPKYLVPILMLLCIAGFPQRSHAQSAGVEGSGQAGFTLRTGTQVVLTDVTVTDHDGKPVHGLKAEDFRIFDDEQGQQMRSFEEHGLDREAFAPAVAVAPGVYSNEIVKHPPASVNVLLLDTTNFQIPDQMYLSYKLTKFLKDLPADEPVAIYMRSGDDTVQLQGFTLDHQLLLAALKKAMPRFLPTGRENNHELDTLHQIALAMQQVPGRKNVLWFSGGSTQYLKSPIPVLDDPQTAEIRLRVYDELSANRIAVYPIDARGLSGESLGQGGWAQHLEMDKHADATGGKTFHDSNDLSGIAAKIMESDGSFYTLTYSPHDFHEDHQWHTIRVAVDGAKYNLSYRRGYFAGGSPPNGPDVQLMLAGIPMRRPDTRSAPIIFKARVLPVADKSLAASEPRVVMLGADRPVKKGTISYMIHYLVPVGAFTATTEKGKSSIELGVAVMAVNRNGLPGDHPVEKVTLNVNQEKLKRMPGTMVALDQRIDLREGENFLHVTVWDMTSGRLGTLQIPLEVAGQKAARN